MLGRALGWPRLGARNLMGTYFRVAPLYPWGQIGRCFYGHWGMRKPEPRGLVAERDAVPRATLKSVPPGALRVGLESWRTESVHTARLGWRGRDEEELGAGQVGGPTTLLPASGPTSKQHTHPPHARAQHSKVSL